MKRNKRHKVKIEKPEASTSKQPEKEERDLAYYIHDRVELVHQVFSLLKPRELREMAPPCLKRIPIDDLKELCTDELLGISSKRLCAILDGAKPPSDTESSSSSPELLETISLDSISSDEEILSQSSSSRKGKKHKNRKHKKKEKAKSKERDKKSSKDKKSSPETTKESRNAGLTVLELLELQARARAIRAQLHKEKSLNKPQSVEQLSDEDSSSESAIEIKEEPAQVVEISSEDEKPAPEELRKYIESMPPSTSKCTITRPEQQTSTQLETSNTTTKRVNNLAITIPIAKPNRKIKLNRTKSQIPETNKEKDNQNDNVESVSKSNHTSQTSNKDNKSTETEITQPQSNVLNNISKSKKDKRKKIKKKTKKDSEKQEKDGSDHDEISLQLSDSEKMDLLEDLGGQNRTKREISSSSEDTESSSDDSSEDTSDNVTSDHTKESNIVIHVETSCQNKEVSTNKCQDLFVETSVSTQTVEDISQEQNSEITNEKLSSVKDDNQHSDHNNTDISNMKTVDIQDEAKITEVEEKPKVIPKEEIEKSIVEDIGSSIEFQLSISTHNEQPSVQTHEVEPMDVDEITDEKSIEISCISDIPILESKNGSKSKEKRTNSQFKNKSESSAPENQLQIVVTGDSRSVKSKNNVLLQINQSESNLNEKTVNRSDGEISDNASSDVEAVVIQPEIVCISDDEKDKLSKKKKKKDKKAKKEKKCKKAKSDFREDSDHNFFSEQKETVEHCDIRKLGNNNVKVTCDNIINDDKIKSEVDLSDKSSPIVIDVDDDVYEILELSDDSSCYEVDGVSISKEPTADEIKALSARIDEFERQDVVIDKQLREHEKVLEEKAKEENNIETITWKDRYLKSKKVIRVMSTANILNAMRKKNKELKKKMELSKKASESQVVSASPKPVENSNSVEEGSIEHYNTLTGSTTYVDPVQENKESSNNNTEAAEPTTDVTKEMKKDAKQLLKMYKRLLKYNDINKQKDPSKKKKKKSKKSKDKNKDVPPNSVTA